MIAVVLLSVLLSGAAAAPMTPRERLDRAAVLEGELEYGIAADELLNVMTDPRSTEEELIDANFFAGVIQRILGNDTQARLHFLYALKRRPSLELPKRYPPKIQTFFLLVREEIGSPLVDTTAPPEEDQVDVIERPDEIGDGSLLTPDPNAKDLGAGNEVPANAYDQEGDAGATDVLDSRGASPDPVAESDVSPWPAFWGGATLAGVGALTLAGAVSGAVVLDGVFYDDTKTNDIRESVRWSSRVLLLVSVVGAVATAGGVGLATVGWLE